MRLGFSVKQAQQIADSSETGDLTDYGSHRWDPVTPRLARR